MIHGEILAFAISLGESHRGHIIRVETKWEGGEKEVCSPYYIRVRIENVEKGKKKMEAEKEKIWAP